MPGIEFTLDERSAFRDLAARVISAIDGAEGADRSAFEFELRLSLPQLYASGTVGLAALQARDASAAAEGFSHADVLPTEGVQEHLALYGATVSRLELLLGDHDAISVLHDPYAKPPMPTPSSLADALTDIYLDLHAGAALFDAADLDSADTRWFGSFAHWGTHAVEVLWALDALASPPVTE
jgi:hypothetical protein